MSYTSHIEERIFAEALATGDLYDLEPEDFAVEELGLLWRLAQATKATVGAVDETLLGTALLTQYGMDRREWLHEAVARRLGRPDLMPAYVASLKSARHAERLAETLGALSRVQTSDPGELREQAMAALRDLPIAGRYRTVGINAAMRATMERLERDFESDGMSGIRTGLATLDRLTGGWQQSDLILLGARPAVGKTAMMLNISLSAAQDGKAVGIVSAEQPAGQLAQRMIAMVGNVPAWKLRSPKALRDDEWKGITTAVAILSRLKIQIFDASAPDMAAVRTAVAAFEADLVCVDYVQRIKGRGESSYDRVSHVAQGLKELARDFAVPVVALAQINRAGAGGAKMENLKGSGDLEQEADLVAILERQDSAEVATLDLVKNRHGATGSLDLLFRAETMVFTEAERGYAQG